MLTIRDNIGKIRACCEFWLVDENGLRDNQGKYIWINQFEVSAGEDGRQIFRWIRDTLAEDYPHTVGAYWERPDKTGKTPHAFRRDQLVKGGMVDASV